MKIIRSLDTPIVAKKPIALTLGNFDALHLGHQALIRRLKELAKGGTSALLTFTPHPFKILGKPVPLSIYSEKQKIHLLEELGIDLLLLIPFTPAIANQTPKEFLQAVLAALPFTHLLLGYDAVLGKNRQGGPKEIQALGQEMGFSVEYLPAVCDEKGPISSTRIRELLQRGDKAQAEKLLGRQK